MHRDVREKREREKVANTWVQAMVCGQCVGLVGVVTDSGTEAATTLARENSRLTSGSCEV
jgi:hypothetical protein